MSRLLVIVLLVLPAFPANAAGKGWMFEQGRTHFSLEGGSGYAFNNSYLVVGVGVSHYVLDGLGVGLSVESWSGSDPGIVKYSPFVQYVFNRMSSVQPYVGGFFRHTVFGGLPSINSVGGRAGVYIPVGRNAYVSVGLVHESYLDCRETIYHSCGSTYSDLGFIFGF